MEEFHGEDFDLEMRTVLAELEERSKELERQCEHAESLQNK